MKPWKSQFAPPIIATITSLQWGHGDEAVEEVTTRGLVVTLDRLQWGHGDEAVEEPG